MTHGDVCHDLNDSFAFLNFLNMLKFFYDRIIQVINMKYTNYKMEAFTFNSNSDISTLFSAKKHVIIFKDGSLIYILESFDDSESANLFLNWIKEKTFFSRGSFRFEDFEDEVLYTHEE